MSTANPITVLKEVVREIVTLDDDESKKTVHIIENVSFK
jgi:hypothetical protein